MSDVDDEEEGALSFLDLLTCGLIGMMVLAIILSVTMATGGAAILTDETSPVRQPVSVRTRTAKEIDRDPLCGFSKIFFIGDQVANVVSWSSDLDIDSQLAGLSPERSPQHHVTLQKMKDVLGIAVVLSPGPAGGSKPGTASDMVASWEDVEKVQLVIETGFEWKELDVDALRRLGLSSVGGVIEGSDLDARNNRKELGELLRLGGMRWAENDTLVKLVPEALARLSLLSAIDVAISTGANKPTQDERMLRLGKRRALEGFFRGVAGAVPPPLKFPMLIVEMQTNQVRDRIAPRRSARHCQTGPQTPGLGSHPG